MFARRWQSLNRYHRHRRTQIKMIGVQTSGGFKGEEGAMVPFGWHRISASYNWLSRKLEEIVLSHSEWAIRRRYTRWHLHVRHFDSVFGAFRPWPLPVPYYGLPSSTPSAWSPLENIWIRHCESLPCIFRISYDFINFMVSLFWRVFSYQEFG